MKGRVITERGRGAQVVEITEDDGRQIAVVAFRGEPGRHSIVWADDPVGHHAEIASGVLDAARDSGVLDAAREALRERDAHVLRVIARQLRVVALNMSGVASSSVTALVLSSSERKISFGFTHRTPETGPGDYEVIIRRRRVDG